jgi:hypothetical protein
VLDFGTPLELTADVADGQQPAAIDCAVLVTADERLSLDVRSYDDDSFSSADRGRHGPRRRTREASAGREDGHRRAGG